MDQFGIENRRNRLLNKKSSELKPFHHKNMKQIYKWGSELGHKIYIYNEAVWYWK